MGLTKTTGYESNTEKEIFQSFGYVDVVSDFDKLYALSRIYENKGLFKDVSQKIYFDKFITELVKNNNIDIETIKSTKYENNKFYILFDNGSELNFTWKDFEKFIINQKLGGVRLREIEKKSQNIQNAIESIYRDNDGIIFKGEIDDDDVIETDEYGVELKGKTLKDLKELLEIENKKLIEVYSITGDTHKKQKLLKNEIKFYTGIGDKYEGGAQYFAMSTQEINKKVYDLVYSMDYNNLISYIIDSNRVISDNYKSSDMVEQVNTKFLNLLYQHTLERMKKENASNNYFIDFVKAITGRGALEIDELIEYNKKTEFEYSELEIDDSNKDYKIANEALVYVMYKKGGLLEELAKKRLKDVKVEDKEMEGRSPKIIVDQTISKLNKLYKSDVGEEFLVNAGFDSFIGSNKSYEELSYDEKVSIGALARIMNFLETSSEQDLKNPEFISEISKKFVRESFDNLNDSLSSNFDESLFDWNGINTKDLNLTGEFAEIFDLYQDINGNKGIIDWKDKNTWNPGAGTLVMGVGLIAGAYFMGPLLVGEGAILTGIALAKAGAIAGAKLGLVTGVVSNVFSHQGYDTYEEAITDVSTQLLVDTVLSSGFSAVGLPVTKSFGNINPDLLFSKDAWTSVSGLADKGFIVGEVGFTGMVVSPAVGIMVKEHYKDSHIDTDKK